MCGLLVLLTADLQAQLIKRINFTAAEGYTNGPLWGQPAGAGANVWTPVSNNQGNSWTNADGSPWIVHTVTNGTWYIWPDQNFGTNIDGHDLLGHAFPRPKDWADHRHLGLAILSDERDLSFSDKRDTV